MANKFQKSVLERLEQEADRQKKHKGEPPAKKTVQRAPQENRNLGQDNKAVVEEIPTPQDTPAVEAVTTVAPTRLPSDIGDFLRRTPQRQAKNKTFYLDGDVITAIKRTAKEQGVADSKLVNDILRRVLGVDD